MAKSSRDWGAKISARSDADLTIVTLSALKEKVDASLDLFADVLLHPSIPPADLGCPQALSDVVPPAPAPDTAQEVQPETMDNEFGGAFGSRLNLNCAKTSTGRMEHGRT